MSSLAGSSQHGNLGLSDMHMYQEALSCMEVIASLIESDPEPAVVNHMYEKCTNAITQLKISQLNPHISDSLQNLLETLNLQQTLLDVKRSGGIGRDRRWTVGEGFPLRGATSKGDGSWRHHTQSESMDNGTHEREAALEDMLLPCDKLDSSLEDIVGLDEAKQILKEAIVMPAQYPQLFQGAAKPWTRLLLYGPPGTGKTKLAKALASELNCPFYNVSSANILSVWIGESEKVIRDLFQKARQSGNQCVIFIDEIDSLCRQRSQREDDHSRRVKTELLRQMEGLNGDSTNVFVLGATNCPWDLDPAFLRRFERRIFVPLPDSGCRRNIISNQFKASPLKISESDWNTLLNKTEGYSGADLIHLTMAAAFQPIRDLQSSRYWKFTSDNKITPCSSDTLGAMQYPLNKLPSDKILARNVELKDFLKALSTTPCTLTQNTMQKYEAFAAQHQYNDFRESYETEPDLEH